MVTFNIVHSHVAIAEPEDLGVASNTDTQQDDLRLLVQPTSPAGESPDEPRPLNMYNKDTSDMVAALSFLKEPNICSPADNGDESDSTVTLYLPSDYASFGHSVVSGDFDGDGGADLAVGSPHVTLDPMVPSQGSVFVVRGQSLFSGDRLSPCEGSRSTPEAQFKDQTDVRLLASRVLHGDPLQPQSRFGWSMAVVDLNQDGIDDLAIGAPGHGANDLTYTGSVFVYFGHSGTGLSMEPDVTIYLNKTTTATTVGTKDRKDTLAGLGFSLQGMDLTGTGHRDLVISMPMASVATENGTIRRQAGRVLAFLAQSRHLGYTLDTDRDWELQGGKAFDWFGSAIALATQPSRSESPKHPSWYSSSSVPSLSKLLRRGRASAADRKVLVVGSPTSGEGDQGAMRGKIQGFVIPTLKQSPAVKIFTVHGDSKFQQLGSRLESFNQQPHGKFGDSHGKSQSRKSLLAVGSQSEDVMLRLPKVGVDWQAGAVRVLDLDALPDGIETRISDIDTEQNTLLSSPNGDDWPQQGYSGKVLQDSLYGSQPMAHLSAAMQVSSDAKRLWLTEPFSSSEKGRILEWEPNVEGQSDDNPFSRNDPDKIKQCFTGVDTRTRFGTQLILADLNGDGVDEVV
ncbi:Glycosylphosphatidylinositol specific phospholipase D1, partial [Podila epicladia]